MAVQGVWFLDFQLAACPIINTDHECFCVSLCCVLVVFADRYRSIPIWRSVDLLSSWSHMLLHTINFKSVGMEVWFGLRCSAGSLAAASFRFCFPDLNVQSRSAWSALVWVGTPYDSGQPVWFCGSTSICLLSSS